MATPPKILIIKTHAIGDVLMATPAFRALRELYPQAHLTLMVGQWSYPVVRYNPHINDFILFEESIFFKKRFRSLIALVRRIRSQSFDRVMILHPSPVLHFFAWLCGIPIRMGLQRSKKSRFLTMGHWENSESDFYYPQNFVHLVQQWGPCSDSVALEAYFSDAESKAVQARAHQVGLSLQKPFLLVAPGGARNPKESVLAKLWPASYYSQLVQQAQRQFPHLQVVLTGGPGDQEVCDLIQQANPQVYNLCAQTSLEELLAWVDQATWVLCNDSSILHMALARSRPVFCIFGPTNPLQLAPNLPHVHVLRSEVPCSPCFQYSIFPGCSHQLQCMRQLTPEKVWQTLLPYIESSESTL